MARLGINLDHVATLRQARRTVEPDPVQLALLAELGGADGITVHLREDRRHVQDRDVALLRQSVRTRLNLEMAATAEMVATALQLKPQQVTLVPERREEITTEGGLDVVQQLQPLREAAGRLQELQRLVAGARMAMAMGLRVNAGHGLTYQNVEPVAAIPGMEELNIGHTIVTRAVAVGLQQAVQDMKALIRNAHQPLAIPSPLLSVES